MENDLNIRLAEVNDCEKIVEFLQKEHQVKIDLKDFKKNCFDDYHPSLHCMIAEIGENLIGCALWSLGLAVWKGKKMFIEGIFMLKNYKDSILEKKFASKLFQNAMQNGIKEIQSKAENKSYLGNFMLKYGGTNGTQIEQWDWFSLIINN